MKLSSGLEWAAHGCAILAVLSPGQALNADALAAYYDLPPAYMAKQMQALSRAGLVTSHRGKSGGYSLARTATDISLLDIFEAIEGKQPGFRCTNIRQKGPCAMPDKACRNKCAIHAAFVTAEQVYRLELAKTSVADLVVAAASDIDEAQARKSINWLMDQANTV